jgi:ATP-binding cassette, subfamily B, bacterial MsbA
MLSSSWVLFKRIFIAFILPEKAKMWGAVFCFLLVALCTAASVHYLQPVLDFIFVEKRQDYLYILGVLGFLIFIVKGFASYGASVLMESIGYIMDLRLKEQLFAHLLYVPFQDLKKRPSAQILAHLTSDVEAVRASVLTPSSDMVKDSFAALGLIGILVYKEPFLSLIALVVLPLVVIPLGVLGRRMRKTASNTQDLIGKIYHFLQQSFQNMALIRSYGMERQEIDHFHCLLKSIFTQHLRAARIRAFVHPLMESLGGIIVTLVVLYGGLQVMTGKSTTGSFVSFIAGLLFLYKPLKNLIHLNTRLQEGLMAAERLFQVLELPQEAKLPSWDDNRRQINPWDEGNKAGIKEVFLSDNSKSSLDSGKGIGIRFQDVGFSYENDRSLFRNLSFEVPRGQCSALVGASGSGKTTIFGLLLRFYEPQKGLIFFDDKKLQDLSIPWIRQKISFVSQDSPLLDRTIEENIAFGNLFATQEAIEKAACLAHAHEFIIQLPKGYQTLVGEMGGLLSGGQRQRIAIARAFLKDAPVLLLDEATSALDAQSEYHVQEALKALMKDRTTLMIAHRFASLKLAQKIMVLGSGELVEEGTHETLLKRNGVYQNLYQLQQQNSSGNAF